MPEVGIEIYQKEWYRGSLKRFRLLQKETRALFVFSGRQSMSRNEGSAASCTPAAETTVGQTGRAQYLRGDAARHRQIKGTEITKQFGGILFLWV